MPHHRAGDDAPRAAGIYWPQIAFEESAMRLTMRRREFLTGPAAAGAAALCVAPGLAWAAGETKRQPGVKLKLALNSYSFNRPLMAHQMTLEDVVDYCAEHN